MDKHLKHAINLALHNIETGGTPYGAVVVCDDKVVGEGFNTIHTSFDVSGHAELIAIRQAQQNFLYLKSSIINQKNPISRVQTYFKVNR